MTKNGRIFRRKALGLLLAAAMLFSGVDLNVLATESNPTTTAEEADTQDTSQEASEDAAAAEGEKETGDGTDTEQDPSAEDGAGTGGEDSVGDGTGTEDDTEKDKNGNEDGSESSVSENTTSREDTVSENTISISENSLSIKAANSLGNLLLSDLQIAARDAGEEAAASYAVGEIEVSGTTAKVMLHAAESCTAVVAIYEEGSEKPYAFGSAVVPVGENQVVVEIEADSLPAYFKAKGYLVETDTLRPLSGEYSTGMYTKAMQEFLAKTADDFGDAPVINLDDDKATNFLVLKDGNLLIKEEAGESEGDEPVNRLVSYDEENFEYTFTNVNDSIKGLEKGDIFIYQYGENDFYIIKVEKIELQETVGVTVAVIAASKEELDAAEVFQHVRIDQVSGTADMSEITQDDCSEGVTYLGREDAVVGYSIESIKELSIAKDSWDVQWPKDDQAYKDSDIQVKAKASFGVNFTVKYYLDWQLMYVDCNAHPEASVEGTVKVEKEFSIPLVNTPLESKDGLFVITYTPKLVIGGKMEGKIHTGMSGDMGFKLGVGEMDEGPNGPYNKLNMDVLTMEAEVDGYAGIKFDPQLKVGDVFNAELELGALLGIKASADTSASVSTDNNYENHDCGIRCFAINGYIDVPLNGELKLLKWKEYDLSEMFDTNEEGSILKIDLAQYYYSIKYKEFGKGECPHKSYMVATTVKDKYGRHIVAGASISSSQPSSYTLYEDGSQDDDGLSRESARLSGVVTDSQGNASIWLPAGTHTLYVSKGGETTPNVVTVDGAGKALLRHDYVEEKVIVSGSNSAILRKDGSLWIWGFNAKGQIGNGTTSTPQTTPFKAMDDVQDFVIGLHKISALKQDGSLWEWGFRPGTGVEMSTVPVRVMDGVKSVYSVDSVSSFCAAITEDGSLYTWGDNNYGLVGNGTTERQATPIKVLDHVKSVEVYYANCAAITEDGGLWMWGRNDYGKIGNGKRGGAQLTPVKVLDHVREVDIANGLDRYAAAITEDGSLYMWGDNSFGQIGNGESNSEKGQLTPYKVMGDVKEVLMWNYTSAAIRNDGSLYMWGESNEGKNFGIGKMEGIYKREKPFKVMDDVKSLQAGLGNFFALKEDGSLYAWGSGGVGLGNGAVQETYTALKIMDGVVDCMADVGIAKKEDGSLYIWGYNSHGQVGNGTTQNQSTPYKVLENVKDYYVDGSAWTVMAVTGDGSLWAWGCNDDGQVGNGSTSNQLTPCRITFLENAQSRSESSYSLLAEDVSTDKEANSTVWTAKTGALLAVHPTDPGSPAVFSGLVPNETYNFYVMKAREAEEPLAPDNLLYIGQYTSNAGGNLSVPYEMREACGEPDIFVVGLTRKNLSAAQIVVPDITYTGGAHLVEAAVTYEGELLTEGVDYKLYGNCLVTEIGEYKVIVKGIGDYCGTVEMTFHVNKDGGGSGPIPGGPDDDPDPDRNDVLPEDIPTDGVIPDGIWIAGISESGYPYTGSAIKPAVRVYDGKILLTEKTDYTISYKNHTKVNDASVEKTAPTITVTGKGNYSGKDTAVFKILPLDIGGEVFGADDMALACNGKAQKPIPALWWDSKKLKNKTDYTVTYYNEAGSRLDAVNEAGNYEIELTGVGNFTGTRRIALHMATECKLMSKMSVAKIPNQTYLTYNSSPVTPAVTVKDGKTVLTEGTHYTVSYSNNTKIGTGYAIVKGLEAGGYSGTKRVSFKITGVSIARATISGLSGQIFIYGGTDIMPALQMSIKSGSEVKTLSADDYSVNWQKNCNAGTATVIVTGNQQKGYTGTVKKTFKIQAFNIAGNEEGRFQAELEEKTAPYAKGGSKPVLRVSFKKTDGTVETLREGTDYTLTCTNNKAVNDGSDARKLPTVTIKGKGNFTGTYTPKLTYIITTQDIGKLSINASDKTYQNKKNIYATKVVITDLDGKALKAGTDYDKKFAYTYKEDTRMDNGTVRKGGETVDKNDIIPAGTVLEVGVDGKGNYSGTLKGTYRITQAAISSASVTIPVQTYTGRRVTPGKDEITVKVKGKKVDSSQYEIVSYQNNVKKGTASVTIRGVENYGGTKTVKFKIRAKGFLWWWR